MKNYIIPFKERYTHVGAHTDYFGMKKIMCIDFVGLIVYHSKGANLSKKNVRSHLIGLSHTKKLVIQANNINQALNQFFDLKECKTGLKFKAWELADEKTCPIIEYAHCPHMIIKGYTACNYYDDYSENSHMVCILDGLDEPPLQCPIHKQMNSKSILKIKGGIWIKTFNN